MSVVSRRVLPGFSLSLGYAVCLSQPARADPAGGLFSPGGLAESGAVLGRRLERTHAVGLRPDLRRLADGGGGQRRARPARRLGAGALRLPAQAALRRPGRSAVRPADGGGGTGVLQPLRAQRLAGTVSRAAGHRGSVLAAGHRAGADLHRLPVRGADRAAGAGGTGAGAGGGGVHAGGQPLADVSSGAVAAAVAAAADRLRPGLRRVLWESTARWSSSRATSRSTPRSPRC